MKPMRSPARLTPHRTIGQGSPLVLRAAFAVRSGQPIVKELAVRKNQEIPLPKRNPLF